MATFNHRLSERPSLTAEAVTLARAAEQRRPPDARVVDDPYAQYFLRRPGRAALKAVIAGGVATDLIERMGTGGMAFVVCRHRYIDDRLRAAVAGGVEQIILLGAGYDSRAYRLHDVIGERPVYEVDLSAISRRKAEIIATNRDTFPMVNVHRVEIDFESQTLPETLAAAGFEPGRPTFVVWEGVAMYLTRATVKATVSALHDLCGPGSELAMDLWSYSEDSTAMGAIRRLAPTAIALIGEPVTFAMHPEDMTPFLAALGFEVADVADAAELQARYLTDGRRVEPSCYLLAARR